MSACMYQAKAGFLFNLSSTFLFEAGSVQQTQSSLGVLLASFSREIPCLCLLSLKLQVSLHAYLAFKWVLGT